MRAHGVRYILFDFFGTLVDYQVDNPLESFFSVIPGLSRNGYTGDLSCLYATWQSVYADMLYDSMRTLAEFSFEAACMRTLESLPGVRPDEQLCSEFMHGLLNGWNAQVRPIEGLNAMLKALQASSYTLAVISNTHYAPLVHGNLARFGLSDCFSHVLTSVEHGQRKPSPDIFQAMLRQLGAQAGECVYVGDNPVDDYAGAVSAGLQPLLIDPAGQHTHVPSERRIPHILGLAPYLAGAAKNQ